MRRGRDVDEALWWEVRYLRYPDGVFEHWKTVQGCADAIDPWRGPRLAKVSGRVLSNACDDGPRVGVRDLVVL